LPQHGDEVGHEVEGEGEVDEGETGDGLPALLHTRVAEQPLEEDRGVRHEPREHADVPLAGADGEYGDQRRVEAG